MTSLSMYSEWTAPTMLSSMWTAPKPKRSKIIRQVSACVKVIDTAVTVLSPVVVSAAAIFAAAAWPAPAHADPVDNSVTNPLNTAGGITTGPIKTAIEDFGKTLCPMLVKPGATLATDASQAQGNAGLTPAIAGVATGMAIQMECPAFMTSLANGQMPALMQALGANPTPAVPFQLPAAGSALPSLFGSPKS